jgi:hypothetical protein
MGRWNIRQKGQHLRLLGWPDICPATKGSLHSGMISQLRARPEDAAVPAWSQDCVKRTGGATWDTVPALVPILPLRRHGSPWWTGCATLMRLQPESSQAGPNDNLAQTAWYRLSAATGLKGAT